MIHKGKSFKKPLLFSNVLCYNSKQSRVKWILPTGIYEDKESADMKHIKTLNTKPLQDTLKKGGCGECQTSCQSACKTSCTVGNQTCENHK